MYPDEHKYAPWEDGSVPLALDLKDRNVLITGGSDGIGKATAHRLAAEGARVAICARRRGRLEAARDEIKAATGAEVWACTADVTEPDQVQAFVQGTVERFGGLAVVINNAGTGEAHPLTEVTPEIWHRDLSLKLHAAYHTSRLAWEHLKASDGAAIINITHPGGKAPGASSLPTSVARAAGMALTKALSKDGAPHGIRVNTVCVSKIITGQIRRVWEAADTDLSFEDFCARRGEQEPLGRMGQPEEVADLIAFLVSARAAFITGTAIHIDGGAAPTL